MKKRFVVFGVLFIFSLASVLSAPYPPSAVIAGITFDQSTLVKAAPGSDQFGYTTGSDNNIYTAWGDGGGFGGTNSVGRVSMGVARIEGTPPSWTPFNVWGGVNPESSQSATLGKTSNGVVAVNGTIYLYVNEQGVWTNNNLWKSTDLGMTWTDIGQMFNEPGSAFAGAGILQFGPDYQGARDNHVYGYSSAEFSDGLGLFRVDKSNIEDRSSYEFFSGFDGNNNPTWSGDISDEARVFSDPAGTEWGQTATYDPYLDRYLLAVRHNGDSGEWGLFDAPEPWGPWTTVAYGPDFPTWTYSKDPDGASSGRPAYIHNFPVKWMSPDGITLWHISDRGDQFNLVKAIFTLVNQSCGDGVCDSGETCPQDNCCDGITYTSATQVCCNDITYEGECCVNSDCFPMVCNSARQCEVGTELAIDNLQVSSNKSYEIAQNLQFGDTVYIDRTYTYSTIPESYTGSTYIKTANDDKAYSGDSFLSFDVNQNVTVYVAHVYDDSNKPSWMSDFIDTGDTLVNSDRTLNLFSKDFSAGTVNLGGNSGAPSMYSIVIVGRGTSSACIGADTNSNSVVEIGELITYITQWNAGTVSIGDLITAIDEWKNGCP